MHLRIEGMKSIDGGLGGVSFLKRKFILRSNLVDCNWRNFSRPVSLFNLYFENTPAGYYLFLNLGRGQFISAWMKGHSSLSMGDWIWDEVSLTSQE